MSNTLQHDAPVLRIMQVGLWCFIIISSITVFFGVHAYVSDYLGQQPWLVQKIGFLGAYLVLSIMPDLLCSIFFAHVVRSLLQQQYRDVLSIILNVALLLIVLFLGRYSWRMSRSAATSAAYDMVPEVALDDVTRLDSLANSERQLLRQQYETDVNAINQRYDVRLQAALAPLQQKALPYRKQIESLETSRSSNNTNWVDKQITSVNRRLLPIQEEISAVTASNERRRSSELGQLQQKHQNELALLNTRLAENRQSTRQRNGKLEQRVDSLTATFSGEFRKIAGWSIIIVLLLTGLLEILYYRNGIKRNPVFTQWNFRLSGLFEVLYLPFSVIGRHTLNAVRRQYALLPDLEPAPAFKQAVTANNQTRPPIVTASNSDLQAVTNPDNTVLQPVNARNNGERESDTCEEKTSPETPVNIETPSAPTERDPKTTQNGHSGDHALRGMPKKLDFPTVVVELARQMQFIMEELFATCAHPDCEQKFRKKKASHKYCCEAHRQDDWERRNGKKLKIKS